MRIPLPEHPVVIAVAVLVIGLLGWGFWPQPVVIEAIVAERAPLTITVEEEGRSRVIDRYIISAPVDGVACRVELNVGDPVQRGEVLLGITPLESQVLDQRSRAQAIAAVAAAQSTLAAAREQASAAEAAAQLATNELKRLQPLARKGLASKGELDRVETEVQTSTAAKRSADFRVQVASYEVQAAQSVVEYSAGANGEPMVRVPIKSPVTGKILKVLRECEGPVRTGEPLLEVGDPAALEVEVDVLSADAVQIKPGMQVLFERWGGDQPLQGVVRIVEPVGFTKFSALGVEEQRVLIISDLTSPSQEWQRLGDGYRVEAKFVLWHEENVLQVPASSLFRYGNGWAVFVVDDQRAQRREVKVGQRNGLAAQISMGLEEGDTVINHPSDEVEDGVRVVSRSHR
jgi:HlyD family secretion protein